jgi:hypothetical protein
MARFAPTREAVVMLRVTMRAGDLHGTQPKRALPTMSTSDWTGWFLSAKLSPRPDGGRSRSPQPTPFKRVAMRRNVTVLALLATGLACSDSTDPALNCTGSVTLSIGTTINGTSGDNACTAPGGETGQLYTFTLASANNVNFAVTGSFAGEMTLYSGSSEIMNVAGSGQMAGRAFLPAGSYTLVMEPTSKSSGAYTINPTFISENANCFVQSFAAKGVSISGSISGVDCTNPNPNERVDNFLIWLKSGQSVSVSGSIARPGNFGLVAPNSSTTAVLQTVLAQTGGTTSFSYTATVTGYHTIFVSALPLPTSYTLSIQ